MAVQAHHRCESLDAEVCSVHCSGPHIVSGAANGIVSIHAPDANVLQSVKLPRDMAVSALVIVYADSAAQASERASTAGALPDACVLSASYNRIHAHHLSSGAAISELEAHADAITSLSLSQSAGMLFSASHDTTVRGWAVGSADWPWAASSLPLVEMDAPDASVPLCCEVQLPLCCALIKVTCTAACCRTVWL